MDAMRRLQGLLGVLLCLSQSLWFPVPSAAQTPSAEDAAYRAFAEAKAREAETRAASQQAREAARRAESDALAAADAELAARQRQQAELATVERQIVAGFDRLITAGRRPDRLLIELELLERWYELLQPVVANLTERSFRPVEVELAGLARQGVIESGERRFARYGDLRARIVAVRERLRASEAESERQKTAIRAELAGLRRRRNALLAQMARPSAAGQQAAAAWLAATRAAARAGERRAQATDEVIRAYLELSRTLEQQRPPVLASVRATAGGESALYRADWRHGDGSDVGERDRQERRRILRERRQMVIEAIEELQAVRRIWTAGRLEAAERMAVRSRLLEQWTQRYADDLEMQWWANLGVDIGLTLAELALTGGAATLERKSAEAVEKAVAEASQAEMSPLAAALARSYRTRGAAATSDTLRSAAQQVAFDLTSEVDEAAKALMRQGVDPRIAEAQARRMFQPAIDQITQLDRLQRLANRAHAEDLIVKNELAQFGGRFAQGLPDRALLASELGEEALKTVPLGMPAILRFAQDPDLERRGAKADEEFSGYEREFQTNTAGDVVVGEVFEMGVMALVNTYKDRPASAAGEALSRWGRLKQFAGGAAEAQRKNARGFGLTIVTGTIKSIMARQTDNMVNADVQNMAELMGELSFLYRQYYIQLQMDRALHGMLTALAASLSAIDQAIQSLDAGYTLALAPGGSPAVPEGSELQLELGFSSALLAAPQVRLANTAVAMQEIGGSNGLRWQGTVPVRTLGEGTHRLTVSVSPEASPHGALDSDPATAAIRRPGRDEWEGFERGPDTRHQIRIALRPLEARDLVGRWVGTGYQCEGAEPEQIIEIRHSPWTGLEAKKLNGDNCIRANELTWRNGQLNGRTIRAEFHTRPPGKSIWDEGFWQQVTIEVMSADELRSSVGITYRRMR